MVTSGFKVFEDGDVLLASEVMGFVMRQQVCVFEDATARDAQITAPQHGQFAFIRDDQALIFYDGDDWRDF
jgi:hypothetical protein